MICHIDQLSYNYYQQSSDLPPQNILNRFIDYYGGMTLSRRTLPNDHYL